MPRPPKARAPLKQAALERFVEQGIHATGIREIAKHAGVSEAALYRHWKNKEDLVHSLFIEHLAEVVALLDAAVATGKDIHTQVQAAATAAFRLYDEQPLVFRFVLLVQHELSRQLSNELRMPNDVVIAMIQAAIKRKEIPPCEPVLASAQLVGMFLETATFTIYGRLEEPLEQYAQPVADAALRVLRAQAR
jgi:AcrR family transcriptional regulator